MEIHVYEQWLLLGLFWRILYDIHRFHSLKNRGIVMLGFQTCFQMTVKQKTDRSEKRNRLTYTVRTEDFNTHPSEFDSINSNKIIRI